MARTTQDMIKEFESFISYVRSLNSSDKNIWEKPIAEGKWTVKDIICHIMLWDEYFYNHAIHNIVTGQPLTVKHLDFDEFNAQAIEYAKQYTVDEIAKQTIEWREKIINAIANLHEDEYAKDYIDGDKKKFNIRKYVRSFVSHDKHHKKQIDQLLRT